MTNTYSDKINGENFFVAEINGYLCKNINGLCKELKSAFNWPGNESCIDAMYHLEWIEEINLKLIVTKFSAIKDKQQKELIKKELDSFKEFWNNKKQDLGSFIIEYK